MEGDPGFHLPGIEQLTFVADGGFSRVYRGYQTQFGRWVAVKVLQAVGDPDGAARRLEREQLAMGRLSQHPNVVTVYHAGTLASGQPYLLMDYLASGSLAQRLARSGPMTPSQVARVGADIAAALATAHQLGVVHGDLKPANVLLGADGQALLTDFGISALLDHTATGQHYLTPAYSAPEQRWQAQVLPASDVWSLGATLFVALSGEAPPQPGSDGPPDGGEEVSAKAARVLQRVGTPEGIIEVIQRCLQVDVLSRPDARTVQQALGAAVSASGAPVPGMTAPGLTAPGGPSTLAGVPTPNVLGQRGPQTGFPAGVSAALSAPTSVADPAADSAAVTRVVSHDELQTAPGSGPPPAPGEVRRGEPAPVGRGRRRVLVALLCLIALVGAALAFVLVRSDGDPQDISGPPAGEAADARVSDAVAAMPLAEGDAIFSGAGDQCLFEGVTDAAGDLVVVGFATSGPRPVSSCCPASIARSCRASDRRYGVYRYRQGQGWRSETTLPGPGAGSQEFHGIVRSGDAVVAIGGSWVRNLGDFAATAWKSANGGPWRQVASFEPTPNDGAAQALIDVTSTGTSLLAVGHSGFLDPSGENRSRSLVAVSDASAEQWTFVDRPLPAGVLSERMQAVTWTGDAFVAGGLQNLASGGWVQALWRSNASGSEWALVHRTAPAAFQEVSAMVSSGATVVAVGPRENPGSDGVVLRSADGGVSWTEVPVAALRGEGDQGLFNLSLIDGWFVAVGAVAGEVPCAGGSRCSVPLVLASRDGLEWQALEVTEADGTAPARVQQQGTTVVTADGGRWFALGYEDNEQDFDARWWELSPPRG